MLYAIIGKFNDISAGSVRGNGKTCGVTHLIYQDYKDGYDIYTNYYTTFSELITINSLLDLFNKGKINHAVVVIDEVQKYLNNSGVSVATRKQIVSNFLAQSRKIDTDIYITTQRYKQIHVELRDQIDKLILAIKFHYKITKKGKVKLTNICKIDKCKEKHMILLYSISDDILLPYVINPEITGKYYNTNEVVTDEYNEDKDMMKKTLTKKIISQMSIEELKTALKT
jgi:hypothetical protein